jgi:hypothetical protein
MELKRTVVNLLLMGAASAALAGYFFDLGPVDIAVAFAGGIIAGLYWLDPVTEEVPE